jgi:hypothetical protein
MVLGCGVLDEKGIIGIPESGTARGPALILDACLSFTKCGGLIDVDRGCNWRGTSVSYGNVEHRESEIHRSRP